MSHEASNWAFNTGVADGEPRIGDPTRKFVLAGLANHAHKDGRNAWVSKESLAGYVECDPKTVGRHLKKLVAGGWIRRGDQRVVSHLRADRRPVVYDLAMCETTRARWHAMADAGDSSWESEQRGDAWWSPEQRGDNLSPRPAELSVEPTSRGDNLSPRPDLHGGTDGVPPVSERGDKALSPEPLGTKEQPPQPPASGGSSATSTCMRPGPKPHANCRRCGTTNSSVEHRERQARAEQRRLEALTAPERERQARATAPPPSKEAIAAAKAHLVTSRSQA